MAGSHPLLDQLDGRCGALLLHRTRPWPGRGGALYFKKYGSKTILVCRLLPFVSFDAVSYFAGLTPIKLLPFLIATGLGQLPATIIYSYVGGMLTGGVKYFVTGLLCIFSLGILVSIIKRVYNDRQAKAGAQKDGSHE